MCSIFVYVCVCPCPCAHVCAYAYTSHGIHVEVRGQLWVVVSFTTWVPGIQLRSLVFGGKHLYWLSFLASPIFF